MEQGHIFFPPQKRTTETVTTTTTLRVIAFTLHNDKRCSDILVTGESMIHK